MSEPRSIYEAFTATAARFGDRPFLHIPAAATKAYGGMAVDYTYAEMLARIDALVPVYRQAGLGRGDRVALMLDNRAGFFMHWFALNALGVSVVPLNTEATVQDLAYIVDDSGPVFLLALPDHVALGSRVMEAAKFPIPVVSTDNLADIPEAGEVDDLPDPATEAALLYTSGSTGSPKGCILSNRYFYIMGDWYRSLGHLCAMTPGEERLLTPLPLVHMNALATSAMCMVLTGGCIIQLDRFHPSSWWQTVAESGATIIHYLGVLPAILLSMPESQYDRAHKVRFGFGAAVNPKHHAVFEERFGFPLLEAWSMTEVGGAAAVIAHKEPRHIGTSCFGVPESFMEWQIVDDSGNPVPKGQPGEFLVRRAGPDPRAGFFTAYYNKPEETAEAWAGGWFHTGDIVREGPDGSLHFVDRKKSIIRRSGENISSLEVEATLSQVPDVAAVGCAPVLDDIRGEEVFAAIVLKDKSAASEATARRIADAARAVLTYYKVPGYIAFLDALPLTASQKLQRGSLKTIAQDLVNRGEAFDLRALKKKPKEDRRA